MRDQLIEIVNSFIIINVSRSMNRYLLLFMGLLVLEIVLCTIQKYVFLSNLGTAFKFIDLRNN